MRNKKAIFRKALMLMVLGLAFPWFCFAAVWPQQKTISGIVTGIVGNRLVVKAGSAAVYAIETPGAALARKNGTVMQFAEILTGDKVEVRGMLWQDNSMNAQSVRNLSLYAHNGTFSGKVTAVDPARATFTMQNSAYGSQLVHTSGFTVFKVNKASAALADFEPGFSVTVKGVWDRSRANVEASQAMASYRLLNIDITAALAAKNGSSLTVVGENNVIYGIDAGKAKIQSKNNKLLTIEQLRIGDVLRIKGKHRAESASVAAVSVKDNSFTK